MAHPAWLLPLLASALAAAAPGRSPDFVNRFPHLKAAPDYNYVGEGPQAPAVALGDVTKLTRTGPASFELACGSDVLRVVFYRADIVRLWLGWGGQFSDPAGDDLVVGQQQAGLNASVEDAGDHFDLKAGSTTLRAQKQPLRLSLLRNGQELLSEAVGISKNATATFQTFAADDDEYFFGGGMQNGRFSHKGHRVRISTDYNWADGGNPNAAPFFLSTKGYGAFRNTWAPGYYDFSQPPVVLAHNESRLDVFLMAAEPLDFRALLEAYTYITGRPFLPPIYGLGLGDSDCYHNGRHGNDTRVVEAVAARYRELDLPGAWFLPNDGYGCGFGSGPTHFPSDFDILDGVASTLDDRYGFKMGLWSSTGLPNISREVGGSRARVFKTDVGWIGNGYKYAFDSVKLCASGIENNSDARRFVWTVEGWAGTQRLAVMWTGDDSGSMDYVRWQVPTFAGCSFSAMAHVTGDIDGIFGGSPESYVRDLQFKCLMTVSMTMSGWAANPDKQPWTWGEPYLSISRRYLKLKSQLTPYFYSLSREAYDTGMPPVRAMALEFPGDNSTFSTHVGSAMQFMAGPSLLVAPVYKPLADVTVREGIYLPAGLWVDYWDGTIYEGPKTLDAYPVPLETLPLFARAGAIVPMWPPMNFAGEKPADPLTLDVYPGGNSSFQLYEDDGVTREALEKDAYATTSVACAAPADALKSGGEVLLSVGAARGSFKGQLSERAYRVRVRLGAAPRAVVLTFANGSSVTLALQPSEAALDFAASGWFFNRALTKSGGLVLVKTGRLATGVAWSLRLAPKPVFPRVALRPCATPPTAAQALDFGGEQGYPDATGHLKLRSSSDTCLTVGEEPDRASGTPRLEAQPCAADMSAKQLWHLLPSRQLQLWRQPKTCLDVDHDDSMAEAYSCYTPPNPNQQWTYGSDGTMRSQMDGRCLTVLGGEGDAVKAAVELVV